MDDQLNLIQNRVIDSKICRSLGGHCPADAPSYPLQNNGMNHLELAEYSGTGNAIL